MSVAAGAAGPACAGVPNRCHGSSTAQQRYAGLLQALTSSVPRSPLLASYSAAAAVAPHHAAHPDAHAHQQHIKQPARSPPPSCIQTVSQLPPLPPPPPTGSVSLCQAPSGWVSPAAPAAKKDKKKAKKAGSGRESETGEGQQAGQQAEAKEEDPEKAAKKVGVVCVGGCIGGCGGGGQWECWAGCVTWRTAVAGPQGRRGCVCTLLLALTGTGIRVNPASPPAPGSYGATAHMSTPTCHATARTC